MDSCWSLLAWLVPLGVTPAITTVARSNLNHSIWTPVRHSTHRRALCQTCHHESQLSSAPPGQHFALMLYRQCHIVANALPACLDSSNCCTEVCTVRYREVGLVGPSKVPSFLLFGPQHVQSCHKNEWFAPGKQEGTNSFWVLYCQ